MPADPVVALLPVTQADREAVQAFHREMGARLMRAIRDPDAAQDLGNDEGDASPIHQAFARHRLAHRTPAPAGDVREALLASLAKRSVGTMDPPWTAAFNAALDMVARNLAPFLKPGQDEHGMCNMGVGCDEAGVCYAAANGDPAQCPKASPTPDSSAVSGSAEGDDDFNRGVLISVSTLINAWGESTQTEYLLRMINADIPMVERMDFTDYDRDPLISALTEGQQS